MLESWSDEEICEFFAAFTEQERKEDFKDLFALINKGLSIRDGDQAVEKYFLYRGLLIKAADTSVVDSALDTIIAGNEKAWKDYCGGKDAVIGRFIGLLTKATSIDPKQARNAIEAKRTKSVS